MVFVGAAMLDMLGRKPVVAISLFACTANFLLHWVASLFPHAIALPVLYLTAAFLLLPDACGGAILAMIADLSPGDLDVRALGFAACSCSEHAATLVVFAASIPILSLFLTSYSKLWFIVTLACAIIAVGLITVLRETHSNGKFLASETSSLRVHDLEVSPAAATGPGGDRFAIRWLAEAASEIQGTWRIVWQDSFLCLALLLNCLFTMSLFGTVAITAAYGIGVIGIHQNTMPLAGVIMPTMTMLGSYARAQAVGKVNDFSACRLGNFIIILGMVLAALASKFPSAGAALFWVGWGTCGFGTGIFSPAFISLVGLHTDHHNRGKIFSSTQVMFLVGKGVGAAVWTHWLFGGDTTTCFWTSRGFLVSAAIQLGLLLSTSYLQRLHLSLTH
mmetsp:Transcript_20598/g.57926  ORF Transcript_20598/g.57926 Transcript_20598/m.57926 type:complete len:390 (-) Transcript_20598:212-1381(-)